MEVTRRKFSKILVAAALILPFARVLKLFKWLSPTRFVRAFTHKKFPGKVYPLDYGKLMSQGKWRG